MRDLCTTGGLDLHLSLELGVGRRTALERALRQAIRHGRLAAGSKLPSTRALAHDLGLARGTVVGAYAQLAAEGYLRAQGSATRVAIRGSLAESWAFTERALERPRFDLRAGRPNLDAFPRAQWVAALRQSLRVASSHLFDYGDPRGDAELRRTLVPHPVDACI